MPFFGAIAGHEYDPDLYVHPHRQVAAGRTGWTSRLESPALLVPRNSRPDGSSVLVPVHGLLRQPQQAHSPECHRSTYVDSPETAAESRDADALKYHSHPGAAARRSLVRPLCTRSAARRYWSSRTAVRRPLPDSSAVRDPRQRCRGYPHRHLLHDVLARAGGARARRRGRGTPAEWSCPGYLLPRRRGRSPQ